MYTVEEEDMEGREKRKGRMRSGWKEYCCYEQYVYHCDTHTLTHFR